MISSEVGSDSGLSISSSSTQAPLEERAAESRGGLDSCWTPATPGLVRVPYFIRKTAKKYVMRRRLLLCKVPLNRHSEK